MLCIAFHKAKSLRWTLSLFICFAYVSTLGAQQTPSALTPAAQIDLTALGYHVPSRMDRLSENQPSASLDFVDADHVLLTFNRKKLLQRLPACPPDHEDRLMHAAILELPGGKVVSETDWFLHDRRRYLWPLGPGKFLLRRLDDLYLIDAGLQEKLLLHSPSPLLWVTVTPDASQIVIETAADVTKDAKPQLSPSQPAAKFVAQFLDAKTLTVERTIHLSAITNLTATSTGYADLVHKNDIWLLRFGAGPEKRRNLARVRSQTVPNVMYSGNNSLLIGRCPSPSCDYSVTAFTVTGRRLWRQHWPRFRYFPTVAYSDDNTRFAVSTLRIVSAATPKTDQPAGPDDDAQPDVSQLDVFQQEIQVFETTSGTPVLSVPVGPAMLTGQNFSLSPDGRRLAVLQGPALESFDLPPLSEGELAKFSALKSDGTASYTMGATPDSEAPSSDSSQESDSAEPTVSSQDAAATATMASVEKQASSSIAVAPTASPQNAPPEPQPIATIRVSAKAVAVDVVVTDGKGHPIKGLRQQDFQVTEDSKPQDLRSFREFSDGQEIEKEKETLSTQAAAPTQSPKASPNVFTNKTHVRDPGAVTLVLFDMLNTPTQDQSYARQQLIKYLQSKPKNAQFALCMMSNETSHLRLIQGFTPDETLLLAAARGKKSRPNETRWQVAEAGAANAVSTVGDLAQEGQTSGFQGLLSALQQSQAIEQVSDTDQRSAITLDSMMLLARYLSGIPGRKSIVWLSGSFPISITATTNSGNLSLDNPNYTFKIKRVTNLLAEAQIAVYPVDVRGLLGAGLSAENSGGMGGPTSMDPQDFSAASVISPTSIIPQDMQALAQQAAERDTLIQFATTTGGKAFYNTNGISQAIALAAEQGSNYYTLSYNPSNRNYDGKFRKIKVQLAEKGYTLHYRQGYYADDARFTAKDAEIARRTRAVAMQHGSPLSHQLVFSARVVPVGGKKKIDRARLGPTPPAPKNAAAPSAQVEVQRYNIDYTFDGSELRFLPQQNASFRNTLTLMAASFDGEGRMISAASDVGTNDLQPAAYEKVIAGQFGVQQEVDVPLEAASLRIGIQDQMSNHLGTVDIALPVPPPADAPRRVKNRLPEIEPD